MYGPAVRLAVSGLASMHPVFDRSVAPGHHGYQRACELISGRASIRRLERNSPPVLRITSCALGASIVPSSPGMGGENDETQRKNLARIGYPMVAPPRSTQNKIVVNTESAKTLYAGEWSSQRSCLSNSA